MYLMKFLNCEFFIEVIKKFWNVSVLFMEIGWVFFKVKYIINVWLNDIVRNKKVY